MGNSVVIETNGNNRGCSEVTQQLKKTEHRAPMRKPEVGGQCAGRGRLGSGWKKVRSVDVFFRVVALTLSSRPAVSAGDILGMKSLGMRPRNWCFIKFCRWDGVTLKAVESVTAGKKDSWRSHCLPNHVLHMG